MNGHIPRSKIIAFTCVALLCAILSACGSAREISAYTDKGLNQLPGASLTADVSEYPSSGEVRLTLQNETGRDLGFSPPFELEYPRSEKAATGGLF